MVKISLKAIGMRVLEPGRHYVVEEGGLSSYGSGKTRQVPYHVGYQALSYSYNCSELHGFPTESVLYVNTCPVEVLVYCDTAQTEYCPDFGKPLVKRK